MTPTCCQNWLRHTPAATVKPNCPHPPASSAAASVRATASSPTHAASSAHAMATMRTWDLSVGSNQPAFHNSSLRARYACGQTAFPHRISGTPGGGNRQDAWVSVALVYFPPPRTVRCRARGEHDDVREHVGGWSSELGHRCTHLQPRVDGLLRLGQHLAHLVCLQPLEPARKHMVSFKQHMHTHKQPHTADERAAPASFTNRWASASFEGLRALPTPLAAIPKPLHASACVVCLLRTRCTESRPMRQLTPREVVWSKDHARKTQCADVEGWGGVMRRKRSAPRAENGGDEISSVPIS